MEILSPALYVSNSSRWVLEQSKSTGWTPAENKAFEDALAVFDKNTPDRWHRVAEMVPGKTIVDVIRQYKELVDDVSRIEAGLITVPGYNSASAFTLECGNSHGFDRYKQPYVGGGKRSRPMDDRKKGIPWTEEEHKLFLMGLKKYGKGDWRNIARNFVNTRTPTQVASHAQKYFIRQLSGSKDKRRASIHDITTVNLNDDQTRSLDHKKRASMDQSQRPNAPANEDRDIPFQLTQENNEVGLGFNTGQGGLFISSPPHGMNSYGVTSMQCQSFQRDALHEPYFGSQSMAFQLGKYHQA